MGRDGAGAKYCAPTGLGYRMLEWIVVEVMDWVMGMGVDCYLVVWADLSSVSRL